MNQLHTVHQEGTRDFVLETGGYFIHDGKIDISVETVDARPNCLSQLLLSLENHQFSGIFNIGDVYHCFGGMTQNSLKTKGECKAWGYHGPHHEKTILTIQVKDVEGEEITVSIDATHDDLRYYGKDSVTSGVMKLRPVSKRVELWNPG